MAPSSIPSISLYNPLRQDPEDLEKLFVARLPLFHRLFSEITVQRADAVPQHQLIIGQRGMGKTTMLARLAGELRKEPHCRTFLPLLFWEEQYIEMDRLSVFWLNCLDSLADAIDKADGSTAAQKLDSVIDRVRNLPSEEDRAREAQDEFTKAIQNSGRRPVLMIDNLNLLFARLKRHDHVLRGFFTRHGAPVIMGAAVAPPVDLSDYDAAFYDGFKTTLLNRLSIEEVREVIEHLARIQKQPQVIERLPDSLPRLSALRDLSGGNPRTTLLIYRLCSRSLSTDIYRDLDSLLDDITPLFQSRFDQLSEQGQKLVTRLARHWKPATAETITELTDFPRGTVSPLLGRLEDEGVIEKVPLYDPKRQDQPKGKRGGLSKRAGYQLAERFFNIWLLMRTASRRDKVNINCLARFIETLYSRKERQDYAHGLTTSARLTWSEAVVGRALVDTMDEASSGRRHDLRVRTEGALLEYSRNEPGKLAGLIDPSQIEPMLLKFDEIKQRLRECVPNDASIKRDDFVDLVLGSPSRLLPDGFARGVIESAGKKPLGFGKITAELRAEISHLASHLGEDAVLWLNGRLKCGQLMSIEDKAEIQAAIDNAPNAQGLYSIGSLVVDTLPELAEKALTRAVEIDATLGGAWECLAILYKKAKRNSEAECAYLGALSAGEPTVELLCGYADVLGRFDRFADAEQQYRMAKQLDPRNNLIAFNLGVALEFQEKASEAIAEYRRAGALDLLDDKPWIRIGDIYFSQLKDYAAAETNYRKAISMTNKAAHARTQLASLLQYNLAQPERAKEQYEKAIQEGSTMANTWIGLADLLRTHYHQYVEAEKMLRIAIDRFNDAHAWSILGVLFLVNLDQPADAERAFRKSIELDPTLAATWVQLAILLSRQLNKIDEAVNAFEQALKLDSSRASYWNGLGNLKMDFTTDLDGAEAAFRKAVVLDPDEDGARHNLVFLLRDFKGETQEARRVLSQARHPKKWKDTQQLNAALFAAYEENWGATAAALREALREIGDGGFPVASQDDWYRASAVLLNLGFGTKLLELLREEGWDQRLLPWYAALEAHDAGDRQMLINSPAEAQDAAGKVFDQIEKRRVLLKKKAINDPQHL